MVQETDIRHMKDPATKIILYLAPLRGFTEYIYRNAFSRHFGGFDVAVAPFIPTMTDARLKKKHLRDVMPENNQAMPVIPQIIGNKAADFILLAKRLFDQGYETVNWNLGCPFPMVAKKQRGSGLLPYPQKIEAFLEATISAIPNRLSIKARLGNRIWTCLKNALRSPDIPQFTMAISTTWKRSRYFLNALKPSTAG